MSARIRKPVTAAATVPADYAPLLAELKVRVRTAQLRAATSVARELNQLYWEIGRTIARAQESKKYAKQVVERLSADLRSEFPGMAGFSPQNLWFMRAFYLAWSGGEANSLPAGRESETSDSLTAVRESQAGDSLTAVRELGAEALPASLAGLPWGHHTVMLTKLRKPAERLWYARAALR
jgi:predicted nuclease of restriction endonuclease-like (RecB) superfamily